MIHYGPYIEHIEDLGKYEVEQFFLAPSLRYINYKNYQAAIAKFPRNFGKLKYAIAHVGYVNHIQSEKLDVVKKSYIDLACSLRIMKIVFENQKDIQCFVNIHMQSNLDFDMNMIKKITNEEKGKNCMLVFEHIPHEQFDDFYRTFSPFRQAGKIGLTFDTAHIFSGGKPIEDLLDGVENKYDLHGKKIETLKEGIKYIPDLIHLNGNSTTMGCGNDNHCTLCSDIDQCFSKETLFKFLRRYSDVPMVLEIKSDDMLQQDLKIMKQFTNQYSGGNGE